MVILSMDLIREIWIKCSLLWEHEAEKVQLTGLRSKKSIYYFTAASFSM